MASSNNYYSLLDYYGKETAQEEEITRGSQSQVSTTRIIIRKRHG
jgi:hypothetical protein